MPLYLGGTNLTIGKKGDDGKSAYEVAVENGFRGTEQDFGTQLANAAKSQMALGQFSSQCTWNTDETVYTQTWSYMGDSYRNVLTITEGATSDTYVQQLFINNVLSGVWTTTVTDSGVNTVYSAR